MRSWLEWAFLGLAAVVGAAWAPGLPFQIEDFRQVAEAASWDGPAELLGNAESTGDSEFIRFFRPVLHASLVIDRTLGDHSPAGHHAWSLAWHVLVVVLLRRALMGLGASATTSLLSALVFAVHPAKTEAVTWIAARGDLLAAVGFLTALLGGLTLMQRGFKPLPLAALLGGLLFALGAKESGLVLPLAAAALIPIAPARPTRRRWSLVLGLAALTPLLFVLRSLLLGPDADTYGGAVRVFNAEIVARMVRDVPGLIVSLATGHYGPPRLLVTMIGGLIVLTATVALLRIGRRRGRAGWLQLGCGFAAFLVLLMPGLRLLEEGSGVAPSRMHYLPSLIFLPALTLGLWSCVRDGGAWARFGVGVGLLFIGQGGWSAMELMERHRDVAQIQDQVSRAIDHATLEVPGGRVVVLDLPYAVDRVPLFGRYLTRAFKPPYRDHDTRVVGIPRSKTWFLDELIFESRAPLRFLAWSDHDRMLVPFGIPLDAPTDGQAPPQFEVLAAGNGLAITPPLALRRGRVLEVQFDSPPASAFEATLILKRRGHRTFETQFAYEPTYGSSDRIFLDWSRELDLLAQAQIDEIVWRPQRGEAPRLKSAALRSSLPEIRILGPDEDEIHPRHGDAPQFRFEDPGQSPLIRFRVHAPFAWSKIFARELLSAAPGPLRLTLEIPGHLESAFDLRWQDFQDGVAAQQFDRLGVRELEIIWSVEGIRGQSVLPESTSPRRRLLIGR
ncbi:MAG: hypothetical protein KDB53_09025 [Planctomycetes bacterium]|nr:hypothetical protein [Planctomycetota bacterium]